MLCTCRKEVSKMRSWKSHDGALGCSPVNHAGTHRAAVHVWCTFILRAALIWTQRLSVHLAAGISPRQMFISVLLRVLVPVGAKADLAALRSFVLAGDGSRLGVLLFPEICTMQLHLLTTGSPDLEVLNHVFHSLLTAVQANQRNATLLYNQVRLMGLCSHEYSFVFSKCADLQWLMLWFLQGGVKTILSGFHDILSQTDPSFTGLVFPPIQHTFDIIQD